MTNERYISGFSDEISSSLDEQLRVVADLGMEFISIRGVDGKNIGDYGVQEYTENVLPRLKKAGIGISSIGSPVGKIAIDDADAFLQQQQVLERLCRIAKLTDTKYIRIFSFYMPEGEDPDRYGDAVAEKIKVFANIAAAHDIVLLHENEKDIFGDTKERCLRLFEAVDSPHFRAIFDFANFVQVGEDPLAAYALLKEHIRYVHVKDAQGETNVPAGTGDGHIKEILDDLFNVRGYNGFLTLEPHLALFDSLQDLELKDAGDVIKENLAEDGEDAYGIQYRALLGILDDIGVTDYH